MRRRNFLWTMGLSGLVLLIGALSFGMNAAYGGPGGGLLRLQPGNSKICRQSSPEWALTRQTVLGQYIPIATKVTNAFFPNDDYYEIGCVAFRERMHPNLPAAGSLIRGYVDLGNRRNPRPPIISDP